MSKRSIGSSTECEGISKHLLKIFQRGYNIGQRLIDELLAKSNITQCTDFKETAEVIAKVGKKENILF